MTDLPADWAIAKALKEVGDILFTVEEVRETLPHGCYLSAIVKLARYIEAHENPPVGRKMLVAREAAARYYEAQGVGYESAVELCREGLNDEALPVVVGAITLWEDGFGKDPEATVPQCQ